MRDHREDQPQRHKDTEKNRLCVPVSPWLFFSVFSVLSVSIAAQSLSYTNGQNIAPAYEGWEQGSDGAKYAYVSWNGATKVSSWRVMIAPSEGAEPRELTTAPRDGFETSIPVDDDGPWFMVQALDAKGAVIGSSAPVRVAAGTSPSPSPSLMPAP